MACILAAGSSSRMSRPKQLLDYKGETLITATVKKLMNLAIEELACITGFLKQEIEEELKEYNITFLHNNTFQEGIGTSLSLIANYAQSKDYDGLLIALSDQPLIDVKHYEKILKTGISQNINIVATDYGSTIGVPAYFHKNVFNQLSELKADKGAKSIINSHLNKTILLKSIEANIDIDTDQDYLSLLNRE